MQGVKTIGLSIVIIVVVVVIPSTKSLDLAFRIAQKGLLVLQIMHFQFSMVVVYQPRPVFWHRRLMRLCMLKLGVESHKIYSSAAKLCQGNGPEIKGITAR